MSLRDKFSKEERVEAFFPFVKFEKDNDYVIGIFIKREDDERKGEILDNVYLVVNESNIDTINITKENPKGEKIKSIVGKIVSFALTTDLANKFNNISQQLIKDKTILAIQRIGLSDKFGVGDNMMILYDVFIRVVE